jgi:hypothetical protein
LFGALFWADLVRLFWGSAFVRLWQFSGLFGALFWADLVRLFWGSGSRPGEAVFWPCLVRCFGLISSGCFGVRLSSG